MGNGRRSGRLCSFPLAYGLECTHYLFPMVDQIGDVMEVSEDFYEQAPENIQGKEFIPGYKKKKVVQLDVAVP